MRLDRDLRVEPAPARAAALSTLRRAELGRGVQHLALQVREADAVVVDDPERADAGRRQVEQRRAAEAARADHQHARGAQPLLPGAADLVQHDVAGVALELLGRQGSARAPVPVEPKPPAPRALAASAAASAQAMRATGASTSWAMRMPWAMVTGSAPWLIRITPTSPR